MPALIWLLLCSTGAYAFVQISSLPAASPAPAAGAASEYRVSNIAYTLGAADPSSISGVKFTLTPSSPSARIATVRAKLISSSSSSFACVNAPAGSQSWACPLSGVAVAAADQLKLDVAELSGAPGLRLYVALLRR
jgi:hypothetical protein